MMSTSTATSPSSPLESLIDHLGGHVDAWLEDEHGQVLVHGPVTRSNYHCQVEATYHVPEGTVRFRYLYILRAGYKLNNHVCQGAAPLLAHPHHPTHHRALLDRAPPSTARNRKLLGHLACHGRLHPGDAAPHGAAAHGGVEGVL